MDTPKKILIFYASAGHGHEKAARAVLEAVREKYPSAQTRLVDTVALMPPAIGESYRQTYLLQIRYTPWLWGIFYGLLDLPWIYFPVLPLRSFFNWLNGKKLVEMILAEQPDTVFTTHFFAAEVVGRLKRQGRTRARLVTVVTDYLPHYIWTSARTDRYAVALPLTRDGLSKRGVDPGTVEVTGIPVEKKFFQPVDSAAIRERLKLKPGIFTVLLTSGGVGVGASQELVRFLLSAAHPPQIVLVCGSNKKLYREMTRPENRHDRLCVLGFVDNMNELMEIADVVVGKAGGLTITESFLKGKPVVMTGSIPGQEARNVVCVESCGAGIEAVGAAEASEAVRRLMNSREEMDNLKKGVAEIARPQAAQTIAAMA